MFDYILVVHDELFDPDFSFEWDDGVLMIFFNWMFIVCQVLGRSGYVVWLVAGIEDNFNYITWKVDGAIPDVVVYHGFLLNHLLWLTPSTSPQCTITIRTGYGFAKTLWYHQFIFDDDQCLTVYSTVYVRSFSMDPK